ncbi:MAG: hypothetical protein ABIE22_01080 [archaeon]
MVIKRKYIKNEFEFKKWFERNYKKLGYSKIIKKDRGKFPDFIMIKKGKITRVELETLSSNFVLHGHNKTKVDDLVCIKRDLKISGVNIREVKSLKYIGGKVRISATIDEETLNVLKVLLKRGKFRNTSHAIEYAIIEFGKEIKKRGKND